MKIQIIRILVAMLLLVACGSPPVLADGGVPRPLFCPPGAVCD